MRILYVVHQFMPEYAGGTERVALNLAKGAQAAGHYAEVVTVAQNPQSGWRPGRDGILGAVVDGVPVRALPRETPTSFSELGFETDTALGNAFEAFLDERDDFDLAHVVHAYRMIDAVERLAARRIPYVVTLTDFYPLCHRINLIRQDGLLCDGPRGGEACAAACADPGLDDEAYGRRFARLAAILRGASAVTAVSEFVAEQVRREAPDMTVRVIGNGVDLLRFPIPRPRTGDGEVVFGYLGTVSEAKGARVLVEAFARAAPRGARLRIVGPAYDEDFAAELALLSQGAAVSFEGSVPPDRATALLAEFDVLCVPSQVPESFSLALHEGFAAGLPVLVSDLGNPARVVAAAGCGLVVPPSDIEAWAAAIGEAVDPGARRIWAARAPLPLRVEEEAFLHQQLYRAATAV